MKTKILTLLLAAFSLIGCTPDAIPSFDYSYQFYYDAEYGEVGAWRDRAVHFVYQGGSAIRKVVYFDDEIEETIISLDDLGVVKIDGESRDKSPMISRNYGRNSFIGFAKTAYFFEGIEKNSPYQYRFYITKERAYVYSYKTTERNPNYQYDGYFFNN